MFQTPETFLTDYLSALNARDLDTARDLIAEDAVYLFSNETAHLGREAILNAISYNFTTIEDEVFQFKNLTWLVRTESIAACIYDFTWSGKIDGQPASGSGRGTSILKYSDGNWQIVNEHLSKGQFAA